MPGPFLRIIAPGEDRETLVNPDHIWKIEIEYAVGGPGGNSFRVSLAEGATNPDARRIYRVFVGGDKYLFHANPGSRGMKVLEDIYNAAIKD